MRRSIVALAGAATLLLVGMVPAAMAASSSAFSWTDSFTVDHACDIVETVDVSVAGRAYFDNDGNWVRDIVRYHYAVTYENAEGQIFVTRTNQVAEYTPSTGTLRAQGYFIRGGTVNGVVFPDVGRLVFDLSDGSTLFATPKIVRFDDPDGGALDAALCEALG